VIVAQCRAVSTNQAGRFVEIFSEDSGRLNTDQFVSIFGWEGHRYDISLIPDLMSQLSADKVPNKFDVLFWSAPERMQSGTYRAVINKFHPRIIVRGCGLLYPSRELPSDRYDRCKLLFDYESSEEERLDENMGYNYVHSTCRDSVGARFFLARDCKLIGNVPPLFRSSSLSCPMRPPTNVEGADTTSPSGSNPEKIVEADFASRISTAAADEPSTSVREGLEGGDSGAVRVVMIHFAMPGCHHCDASPEYLRIAASVAAAAGNRVFLLGDAVTCSPPRRTLPRGCDAQTLRNPPLSATCPAAVCAPCPCICVDTPAAMKAHWTTAQHRAWRDQGGMMRASIIARIDA
jgi:hypothetical protein